jgi:glycosyltransferase involved in cell wall biosynthesis
LLLQKMGIPGERVSIIANPLPPRSARRPDHAGVRRQLGLPADAIVLLGVGRLAPEKNFRVLIDAVRILCDRGTNVAGVIVGAGPQLAALHRYCQSLGIGPHVKFAGFHADVEPFYEAADYFLQPSLMELQSLAMLESMRAGLPVLVAEHTGCNDDFIVNGENGFLLDPTRAADWADCVQALLPHADRRRLLGERAAATVASRCEPRGVAARFESLYADLAER